ncbi:MAG: MIP/aquaporin family protein [Pseudomonadota bacterium]|nr:MIP/aquaporin family protein [Pseudomonadota bacterium]
MSLSKRVFSEFLGTCGLLIVIVGSGIMGETLSQGNLAMTLLANSLATGAGLYALIQIFGPISGAHFNPTVSFVELLWKKLSISDFVRYSLAQISGAILGVLITHIMFGKKIFQLSSHDRGDFRFLLSEVIATFGLISVISLSGKRSVESTPLAVALYITSAYWCTSSTSFANPAVTIARGMTDTFSGILWTGIPGFIVAQFAGAMLAYLVCGLLSQKS